MAAEAVEVAEVVSSSRPSLEGMGLMWTSPWLEPMGAPAVPEAPGALAEAAA